jgi:hypothetical protein
MIDLLPCPLCHGHSLDTFVQYTIASDDPSMLLDPRSERVVCADCGCQAALRVWQRRRDAISAGAPDF